VLAAVEFVFYGALVRAGTGSLSYDTVASRLDGVIELILQAPNDDGGVATPAPRRRRAKASG
jgi:hypothetical protein